MTLVFRPTAAAVLFVVGGLAGCAPEPDELVVYSARNEELIAPIFERYRAETGQTVRYITGEAEPLTQRLQAEGDNTPADLLLTVDAGNLWYAAGQGLLREVDSGVLETNLPGHLRDPQGQWFGLSVRARTIVYSSERVDPAGLASYAALAEPQWRGRLCLRTSKKVYNQSLVAMLIAEHGEPAVERIVAGWVRNLATDVFANDTQLMEAIVAGQCDLGIVNTYYFGRLQRQDPAVPLALFWPDQDGAGVHVNVSGAGVVAASDQPESAVRLLEWLSSAEAQQMFAGLNLEYPANPAVAVDPLVAAWGEFRQSDTNLARAGELQADAVRLMDRVGYR